MNGQGNMMMGTYTRVWLRLDMSDLGTMSEGNGVSLTHGEFDEQTTRSCERHVNKVIERMQQQRAQQGQSKQWMKKDKA